MTRPPDAAGRPHRSVGHRDDRRAARPKKLHRGGIDLVSLSRESGELDLAVFDPRATDESPIEMVLALGGDGTLLRAAEHARPLRAPVLGINLGRVGFLTEVDVDQLDEALDAIIDRGTGCPSDG